MAVPATAWQAGMRITADRLLATNVQHGTELTDLPAADTSEVIPVTFPLPFPTVPTVVTGFSSGAGSTGRFEARPINVTVSGFDLFILVTDTAETSEGWTDQPVSWIATV